MPELPEVELVARSLDSLISGRRIVEARLLRERLAPRNTADEFGEHLRGAVVNFVRRRGKHILIDLDNARTLLVHLRMSGRFMLLGTDRADPKFTHAVFYLDDESRLVFQDQRHFGFMRIVETVSVFESDELRKLAPEPFSDEFNEDYLKRVLRSSKKSVKELLIDQTKVLGLGNIYVSEALFLAGVSPRIAARRVPARRIPLLFRMIREVLAESIGHGSTLNVDPENIDGSYYGGGYENSWRVYDREGEPCPNCSAAIVRIKQGGRSTYFCRSCQK